MENWKLKKLLELDAKNPGALDDLLAGMVKAEKENEEKVLNSKQQALMLAYKDLVKHLPGIQLHLSLDEVLTNPDFLKRPYIPRKRKKAKPKKTGKRK